MQRKLFIILLLLVSQLAAELKYSNDSFFSTPHSSEQKLDSFVKIVQELQEELTPFLKLMESTENFNYACIDDAFLTDEFIKQMVASLPKKTLNLIPAGPYGEALSTITYYRWRIYPLKHAIDQQEFRLGWQKNSLVEELDSKLEHMRTQLKKAEIIINLERQDPRKTFLDRARYIEDANLSQLVNEQDKIILKRAISLCHERDVNPFEVGSIECYLEKNNSRLSKIFVFRSLLKACQSTDVNIYQIRGGLSRILQNVWR